MDTDARLQNLGELVYGALGEAPSVEEIETLLANSSAVMARAVAAFKRSVEDKGSIYHALLQEQVS